MNKTFTCNKLAATAVFASVLLLGLIETHAQEDWHRKGMWEIYGTGQYLFGDQVDYSKFGLRIDIQDTVLVGFGGAYHFNDHLDLTLELGLGLTDFNSSGADYLLNQDTLIISGNLNVEYNIFKTRFTPLVRAGIGFYNFSDDAPASGSEPCGFFDCPSNTYDETDLSWNVGAGVRWNVTDHFVLKLVGGISWTELKDSDDLTRLGFVALSIGGSF